MTSGFPTKARSYYVYNDPYRRTALVRTTRTLWLCGQEPSWFANVSRALTQRMLHLSTFSIVACDIKEQAWGIAVASKFPAVGAVVPWARVRAGAVATQAYANTSFGPRGLEMMAGGMPAKETLSSLIAHDHERDQRQIGLVDAKGNSATFTGKSCREWAGGVNGPGYAIQGNILTGAEVINRMEHTFLETKGELPERLFAALQAGGHVFDHRALT